jgi:hypothetical protein
MTDQPQWVVRLWDGFDGEWMEIAGPMSEAEARREAEKRNQKHSGNKHANFSTAIDYYRAFPADTKMVFSDGHSMTRGDEAT